MGGGDRKRTGAEVGGKLTYYYLIILVGRDIVLNAIRYLDCLMTQTDFMCICT